MRAIFENHFAFTARLKWPENKTGPDIPQDSLQTSPEESTVSVSPSSLKATRHFSLGFSSPSIWKTAFDPELKVKRPSHSQTPLSFPLLKSKSQPSFAHFETMMPPEEMGGLPSSLFDPVNFPSQEGEAAEAMLDKSKKILTSFIAPLYLNFL
jgi:hypothetical protein